MICVFYIVYCMVWYVVWYIVCNVPLHTGYLFCMVIDTVYG